MKSMMRVGMIQAAVAILVAATPAMAQKTARGDDRRAFYLTPNSYDGAEALLACAPGFHMASMWEILDPTNLKYETTMGMTRVDAGEGPPAGYAGWVRTGSAMNGVSVIPGHANCNAWTSNDPLHSGTRVFLGGIFDVTDDVSRISPWRAYVAACSISSGTRVWCVQD